MKERNTKGGSLLHKRVLIIGSTGGAGRFAHQLARLGGASIIGTARQVRNEALVEAGAETSWFLEELVVLQKVIEDRELLGEGINYAATPKISAVASLGSCQQKVNGRTLGNRQRGTSICISASISIARLGKIKQ